jgi:16S rRNA (guanine966-N2)-methyltransferase
MGAVYPTIPHRHRSMRVPRSRGGSGGRSCGPSHNNTGVVRIIAGRWRGRKLVFPAQPGLRPTGDRLRETLFNWLQPLLPDARCLDLFAGSGALGLEAASRGAALVSLIESSAAAAQALRNNCARLEADRVEVINTDALVWLARRSPSPDPYTIAFVDPPFASDLLRRAIPALETPGVLAEQAWIYLETARGQAIPELPPNWHLHREKCSGDVCCRLFRRVPGAIEGAG